ncbi:hypothetical protein CDD80_5196 [Ophiocordyceps camponoti-rufipedis]|uniref:Fungal lipase-type domain-containing protein n=1 Tax=Ophiocordyceps camponoti-rufipedis TaxID=2004952 RepID=A0A2C5ZBN6_9HYPO|nr:hypothetical protein CDD80_5196 [Ophiocordyceps camponoti-rufipedis]
MLCVSQVACNRIPISQQMINTFRRYAEIASAAYAQNCPQPPQGIQILRYIDNRTSNTRGFLAADPRNQELIISLRGTDNVVGLISNVRFGTTFYKSPGVGECTGCEVHKGFMDSWNSIAPSVMDGVTSILRSRPGLRITITGHSTGAALASLATASLRGIGLVVTTYTFGQPRTGNQQYADYIDYLVPQAFYRITHKDDGIPQLSKGGSFRHHSTEFWQSTDEVSPKSFYRCLGQEPVVCQRPMMKTFAKADINQDCNNFVDGNGIVGLNMAHLKYLGVSMGDSLDRGASQNNEPSTIDKFATMQILAIVVAAAITYYLYQRSQRDSTTARKKTSLPPVCNYSDPSGLVGLVQCLQANNQGRFLEFVQGHIDAVRQRVGRPLRTVALRVLFARDVIFTFDPVNIQAILSSKSDDYRLSDGRTKGFKPYLGNGIFAAEGHDWEFSRALLRPHFFRSKIHFNSGEKHVQAFISALEQRRSKSCGWTQFTDIQELFFRYTLDSTIDFLFGRDINSQLGADDGKLAEAIHQAQSGISLAATLGPLNWFAHTRKFKRAVRTIHDVIDPWILAAIEQRDRQGHTEQDDSNSSLLETLTSQTRDAPNLRGQLLSLLAAGHDTTASTLSWFVVLMGDARNEAVLQRLRAAVIDVFGEHSDGEEITFGRIKSCQYLQWCIDETLRLYPSIPMNLRIAKRDTVLPTGGGEDGLSPISLRKGEEVNFSVHLLHRCKEIWGPDAHLFRPERWAERPSRWEYLPFNDGPRSCIGQQFALARIAHMMIRLLQRIDAVDASELNATRQRITLVNLPAEGVPVRLRFVN